jgi:hypothetical protein
MMQIYPIRFLLSLCLSATLGLSWCYSCWATTRASDSASELAYSAESDGAWKGTNPTPEENPPGMDNGGFGFEPWNFIGGYHEPTVSPYGNLNHFIDGVDFSSDSFNDLGSPAFGLTNAGTEPAAGYFGYTARATRVFESPLEIGDTFSVDIDNPIPQPLATFTSSGFLIRMNTGGGPVIESDPLPGVEERFGLFITSNFNNGRWAVTDSAEFTDTGLDPSATASGARFRFTLDSSESYKAEFVRLSDSQVLFSRSGTLNNTDAGLIDTVEITLYNNGSSSTGEREFFFNNLSIVSASSLVDGDFDLDGDVDGVDLLMWQRGESPNPLSTADLAEWEANYGTLSSSLTTKMTVVPEPTSLILLLSSLVTAYLGSRMTA